jgi:allose kinase
MAAEYYAGVDVGGTHVRMGIVDTDGRIVRESTVPTASLSDGRNTPQLILGAISSFLGPDEVAALCIGFPSVVSRDRRTVVQTPNVPGLDDVPMVELAERRFPFPVFIEKDVNLLLLHDVESLDLGDLDPILGFYLGTGLGNALMIGGRVYTGAMGAAGELGHTPVRGVDAVCSCGNVGCVEMVASGKALAAYAASAHPGTPIGEFFVHHGDDAFVAEFLHLIAMTVSTEINILDPAMAIFGGGIVHMAGFPHEAFIAGIKKHLRPPYPKESARLIFSRGSRSAGVLGAAGHARALLASTSPV